MKKILFTSLTGYPNPSIGGPTRIIYELLKNLDYSKYEPYFLSYDMFTKYSSSKQLETNQSENISLKRNLGYMLYNNIKFYRTLVTSAFYMKYHNKKRDKYFLTFVKDFADFDVIHCHDPLSAYYFLGLKKPMKILTIHSKGSQVSEMRENSIGSIYLKEYLTEFSKREIEAYSNFDIITFPSIAAKKIFLSETKMEETKVNIIYNGIDLKKIEAIKEENVLNKYRIEKTGYDITLLNVAQHVKPKNIDLIIQSIQILRDVFHIQALLVNVGEGSLTESYRFIIESNNLKKQVKLLGTIPNDDVIRLMKSLDIFIQASEKVIFDLVVIEALASGAKVLVSNEGGNKEIIVNGFNGFMIPEITPGQIAKNILNIVNDSTNSNIALKAKNTVDHFNVRMMVDKYVEAYDCVNK